MKALRNGLILLVLAGLAGGGWWWWSQREAAKVPQFRLAKITRGPLTAAVSASGTINPVASVQVGSQVSGQIREVLVDFNSNVKADQIIARIDPESYQYRVRQAQADLDAAIAQVAVQQAQVAARRADVTRAEVTLADGRLDLSRKEQLVERNFISPAERDKARSVMRAQEEDLKAARAALDVAGAQVKNNEAVVKQRRAALASAQVDLDRTVIKSPVDGVVIKRSIDAGQTVAASLQAPELFIIAKNLRDMQVDTAIDESEIGKIKLGQRGTFTVDAFPGRTFEGSITQVRKAAQSNQNVVTYIAVVTFVNDGALLPGMTANVRVVTDTRPDVLQVPNAALRFRPPEDSSTAAGSSGNAPAAAKAGGAPPGNGNGAPAAAGGTGSQGAGRGPGAGAGNALAAFRERLEKELALTPEQKQKVDGVYAGMRAKFMAVRELPEEERARASAANRAEVRARIMEILTPEQQPRYEAMLAEAAGRAAGGGRGRIYQLVDGKPRAIEVRTGVSDGTTTEVAAAELREGTEIIVGRVAAGSGPAGTVRPPGPPRIF